MLQVQFIKENTELIVEGLKKRNFDAAPILKEVIALDDKRRSTQVLFDDTQAESNKLSKEIGILFKKGEIQKANILKEKTVQLKEKTKALNKHYRTLVWKYFKDFFKLPKIILTLFLIWCYYNLLVFIENRFWLFLITFIILMITPLMFFYYQKKHIKFIKKETGKKWMFEEIISGYGSFSAILMLPIHVFNAFSNRMDAFPNDYVLFGISLILVALFLSSYIVIVIIPSKAEEYLKETYPEYGFVE